MIWTLDWKVPFLFSLFFFLSSRTVLRWHLGCLYICLYLVPISTGVSRMSLHCSLGAAKLLQYLRGKVYIYLMALYFFWYCTLTYMYVCAFLRHLTLEEPFVMLDQCCWPYVMTDRLLTSKTNYWECVNSSSCMGSTIIVPSSVTAPSIHIVHAGEQLGCKGSRNSSYRQATYTT